MGVTEIDGKMSGLTAPLSQLTLLWPSVFVPYAGLRRTS